MKHIVPLLSILLLTAPALAEENPYGPGFHRAEFWSGEYPAGFTVLEDTVLKLRPALSPDAEATIDCPVTKGATYHSWNIARSISDGLAFVSFTLIEDMTVTVAIEAAVYGEIDPTDVTLSLKPGATWRYLAYYAEGTYLMEYDGVRYVADQSLQEASTSSVAEGDEQYHEWLRINCANNMWGWLQMSDVAENPALGAPNIVQYGEAADVQ